MGVATLRTRMSFRTGAMVGSALLTAITAYSANFQCGGLFTVGSEHRHFDGNDFTVVRLESKDLTIGAYTFGAWIPQETGGAYGLVLNHQRIAQVHVGLCPLVGENNPQKPAQWDAYIAFIQAALGEKTEVSNIVDSTADRKVVQLLDWTTREATFSVPAVDGHEPHVEIHVVVSGDRGGLRVVLFGPQSQVEEAKKDFRFFLSRLDRPK